ncbi:MAG: nuclear transport factor 2 family protein [Sneathiella sp.]
MSITETAMTFFDACETGKGWDKCKIWCHEGASFSCQADMLAEVTTVEGYVAWVHGLFTPVPDMRPEIKAFATDTERNSVTAFAVVHGTQTGEGGPVPPTGKTVAADYVYVMQFDGDKISHMTKIWNDGHTAKQLGWA